MLAQVARAVRAKQDIVFLGWAPHPINNNFDLVYLSGGDDVFGPDYGGATVYTNVRKGYAGECPNVGKLLSNLEFSLPMEGAIMGAILNDGKNEKVAATEWLKANPGVLDGWLAGVQTVDGKDGLAAVKAHLRSEEHTSELQSLMRISYAVFCVKKKNTSETEDKSRE